ncbi:MAG TPA: hypothetical protein VJ723_00255 [Candidatus Angelobacter sp.]|nr:hypothetical protein [Candidatus Angelobacter sp.]
MKKILAIFLTTVLFFALAGAQTEQKSQPPSDDSAKPPARGHKITPEETKELFQQVDEILRFASERTLLPIKHPVKKAMVDRAAVEKYIEDKFKDDVERIRFERSELVLKKFGMLPRTFDLHTFLVKLLGEQVAGYYDEETKTMNLLDWVEMEMQRPVMAHELTHALQDQSFDLGKLTKKNEAIEKRGPEDPNALIKIDEESGCRSAVMEGQAMVVFVDYVLAPAGHTVEDSPKFVDLMLAQIDKSEDSPLLASAPLLIKEELVFPYSRGMKFIATLLASGGKKLAYTGVLERMPLTTREVMEPQEYLAGRRVPQILLPDMDFLKKDFDAFDAGVMGELDVSILLKQYANAEVADRLSPEWRGGSYYAAGRKGVKPVGPGSTGHIGLLYVSKWSSEKAAEEFARVYASSLPQRYSKLERVPATGNASRDQYTSSDGLIILEQHGDLLVITESFDAPTADKLISAALKQTHQTAQGAD